MTTAHSDLLRKFTDLAFGEIAGMRSQESQRMESDNVDVVKVTGPDLQSELLEPSRNPFWFLEELRQRGDSDAAYERRGL